MDNITIQVERVHCECAEWVKAMKIIQSALKVYDAIGFASGTGMFRYCPYCGKAMKVKTTTVSH